MVSDSFADLWSSSAPLPPKPAPQTLGGGIPQSQASSSSPSSSSSSAAAKRDAFSLLAGSAGGGGSGGGGQRYGSPAGGSMSRPLSALGGRSSSTTTTPAPRSITPSASSTSTQRPAGDAFSDLFSAAGGKERSREGMSLAERLAAEKAERTRGVQPLPRAQVSSSGAGADAWAGLDSLAGGGGSSLGGGLGGAATKKPVVDAEDDWGLGDFGSSATKTSVQPTMKPTSQPSRPPRPAQPQPQPQPPASQPKQKKTQTLWDLDDFASPSPSSSQDRPSAPPPAQSQTTKSSVSTFDSPEDDFDFGHREDLPPSGSHPHQHTSPIKGGLLDIDTPGYGDDFGSGLTPTSRGQRRGLLDDHHDEEDGFGAGVGGGVGFGGHGGHEGDDDLLGMLGKPVEVVKKQKEAQRSRNATASNTPSISRTGSFNDVSARSSSPPPHILGQIVEMGFSIGQAKMALAATKDGRDVQAALDMLLGGGASASRAAETAEEERPPRARSAPKGFKERERERMEKARRDRDRERGESSASPAQNGAGKTEMQEQADRLLSQASEIGLSVLSKASLFWKEGKEKVAKVYEERTGPSASAAAPMDGRPKWMADAGGSFKDDEQDEEERRMESLKRVRKKREVQPEPEVEVDLFSEAPVAPSARQRPPPPASGPPRQQTKPTPPIAAPQTRDRPLPTAAPSALAAALKHKTLGTEQFKLGQYGPSIESYGSALAALPRGHLLSLPLYANRALARMRNGEYKGAVEDAGCALGVIMLEDSPAEAGVESFDPTSVEGAPGAIKSGPVVRATSWSPSIEPAHIIMAAQQKANEGGWAHPQGLGVDLADLWVKALRRRAEGWEGRERWAEAGRDWEVLSAGAWVVEGVKREAQRGAARCRKMVEGCGVVPKAAPTTTSTSTSTPKAKPKPKPKPAPVKQQPPSAALLSLQATTAQSEADDALKISLKDGVDARLAAWRTGKESNIRALLASLDMVLWEEVLKGVRVGGLHELVSAAQVKKGYVRVIARVHPDKLNAGNATVEQRMLANEVFGTLNEAWIAFQNGK